MSKFSITINLLKIAFVIVSDRYAPKISKVWCENQKPHKDKVLHKAVMKGSELKHKAN